MSIFFIAQCILSRSVGIKGLELNSWVSWPVNHTDLCKLSLLSEHPQVEIRMNLAKILNNLNTEQKNRCNCDLKMFFWSTFS